MNAILEWMLVVGAFSGLFWLMSFPLITFYDVPPYTDHDGEFKAVSVKLWRFVGRWCKRLFLTSVAIVATLAILGAELPATP